MPRVSVIIPAHNAADYLEETLASVVAQTYADWEIVACDDGSSDATWQILSEAGPRVRAVRNERAGGPAVARNRALREASGEFAAFLDADDLLLPTYLERQLETYAAASTTPGTDRAGLRPVGLVTCDARLLIDGALAPYTHLDLVRGANAPITLERLLRRNVIYPASLVPMAAGAAVGWFDPELFGTEDYGLWIKLLERGYRAVRTPEPLAVYRRVSGTVSTNLARQGENNRRAYELALRRGNLTPRQARIARAGIRYNRAMEEVARARFRHGASGRARPDLVRIARALPLLTWVALTNPAMWSQWARLLRTGRAPDAPELRAET